MISIPTPLSFPIDVHRSSTIISFTDQYTSFPARGYPFALYILYFRNDRCLPGMYPFYTVRGGTEASLSAASVEPQLVAFRHQDAFLGEGGVAQVPMVGDHIPRQDDQSLHHGVRSDRHPVRGVLGGQHVHHRGVCVLYPRHAYHENPHVLHLVKVRLKIFDFLNMKQESRSFHSLVVKELRFFNRDSDFFFQFFSSFLFIPQVLGCDANCWMAPPQQT